MNTKCYNFQNTNIRALVYHKLNGSVGERIKHDAWNMQLNGSVVERIKHDAWKM